MQVHSRTQVAQQQEALLEIVCEHFGRVEARVRKQAGDRDKRPAIFVWRRRVHRDKRARLLEGFEQLGIVSKRHAKITAEARILRRR